jgi:7-cyano-7-deazaguanine synthase
MSKLEEVDYMKSLGLSEIIRKTHFCHHPVFGLTCGQCNPCKDALNEGMEWRVSKLGMFLGLTRKYVCQYPRKVIAVVVKCVCKQL